MPATASSAYQARNLQVTITPHLLTAPMSFTIPTGRLTCIIGKNGSGKTTLLKALAGLTDLAAGSLHYQTESLAKMAINTRCAQIAWCPERLHLPPQFSVRETIALGLFPLTHRAPSAKDLRKVDALARSHGLEDLLHRQTHSLSSGECRKVGLLRTLIGSPSTLLLDEPTSGLDPAAIAYLMHMLKGLTANRTTVVCVLHHMHLVSAFGDHVIALNQRSLDQSMPAAKFFASTQHLQDLFHLPVTTLPIGDTTVHQLDYLTSPPPQFG